MCYLHVCLGTTCVWYLWRPEEGMGYHGTGVTGMWVLGAKPQSSAKVASALCHASFLQPLEPALLMDRLRYSQLWNGPFSLPEPCCPLKQWFHIKHFFVFILCLIYSCTSSFCFSIFSWNIFFFCTTLSSCLETICSFSVVIICMWQGECMYRLMHLWALQVQRHVLGWVCSCWLEYDQLLENLHPTF